MTRDGEIPAIFNPKRVRAPSVVVTGDSPKGPFGGFTNIVNATNSQIPHSDSMTSSQPDTGENAVCVQTNNNNVERGVPSPAAEPPQSNVAPTRRFIACKESCCSQLAQKMYFGVCVTIFVTASWVGATHCLKYLYSRRTTYLTIPQAPTDGEAESDANNTTFFLIPKPMTTTTVFSAPFFASWFCTNFSSLFFPIYLVCRALKKKCGKPDEVLGDVLRGFRDRGFTIGRFLNRCMMFCLLWILTTYLYVQSLKALLATDVLALFATNVTCVYLLSWVILHEQFVGVRIVAVILCDTGIALLAYMDGITGSPTLGSVVLAALAAAGYAVFKVMFRKVMGDPPVGQIAFTFTTLGFLNATMLWPICLALYFTGSEIMPAEQMPWILLLIASLLLLLFHMLTQFSSAVTYNMFVILGLITAVPVSGALDVVLYGAQFAGMKLAGVILIAVGFFLVMFPENWPDYITRLLRKTGRAILRYQCCCEFAEIDYDNSMGSRSPQRYYGGSASCCHRLSDGLYTFPSSFPVRSCEMTDLSPTSFMNYISTSGHPSPTNTGHGIGHQQTPSIHSFGDEFKKTISETNFLTLSFKRKSSYAATD